ncbi:hypothetical protein Henu3_gp34 [Mycobacterium phage Henu3]|uniref:Uncharacterized protein n=1 Tax=Mycobacterium phage Henu3 TaxID=2492961 RepID=A0A410T7M9_9CAUD|nr:hypothetical protein I5G68_gp31 [Mycobacterium phage Henu3]QAU04978.1 hypothetical protein Henu3_gp34 [Mycobacterium phage Henu3]
MPGGAEPARQRVTLGIDPVEFEQASREPPGALVPDLGRAERLLQVARSVDGVVPDNGFQVGQQFLVGGHLDGLVDHVVGEKRCGRAHAVIPLTHRRLIHFTGRLAAFSTAAAGAGSSSRSRSTLIVASSTPSTLSRIVTFISGSCSARPTGSTAGSTTP